MWPTERTMLLIDRLRTTPSLWDKHCRDYKNREKKKEEMQRLADEFLLSFSDMEKKIHALKTQFRREHKKLSESQSGSSAERYSWFGYQPLRFLLSNETGGRGMDDTASEDLNAPSISGEAENDDWLEVPRNGPSPPGEDMYRDDGYVQKSTRTGAVKRRADEDLYRDDGYVHKSTRTGALKRSADEDKFFVEAYIMKTFAAQAARRDDHSVFGELVASRLRKCGRPHHDIVVAQHKIETILFELVMGSYDKNSYRHQHYQPPQTSWHNPPTVTNSEVDTSQGRQNSTQFKTGVAAPSRSESSAANLNKLHVVDGLFRSDCSELVIDETIKWEQDELHQTEGDGEHSLAAD